jgi:hypothetical protein
MKGQVSSFPPFVPPAASLARLTLVVEDAPALRALFDQHLSKGRAFVPGATGVSALEACVLVLEHAGRQHELAAEAVFVQPDGPGFGVGVQLAALDAAQMADLRTFIECAAIPQPPDESPEQEREEPPPTEELGEGSCARPSRPPTVPPTLLDRIRGLSLAEQQRVAAHGNMPDRIALERAFGANVWEALLGNPRITTPEVARIARKGTVPRPLIETIAGHPSWLAAGEVQRALLGNPRTTPAIVAKVLSVMTRADLQLVPIQTAYPQVVRMQARRLLGR